MVVYQQLGRNSSTEKLPVVSGAVAVDTGSVAVSESTVSAVVEVLGLSLGLALAIVESGVDGGVSVGVGRVGEGVGAVGGGIGVSGGVEEGGVSLSIGLSPALAVDSVGVGTIVVSVA